MVREKTVREMRQGQQSITAGTDDLIMLGGVMTTKEAANKAISEWGRDEMMEDDITKLKDEMLALKEEIKQSATKTVIVEPIADETNGDLDINVEDDTLLIDVEDLQNLTDAYDEQQKVKVVEKIVPSIVSDTIQPLQQQSATIPAPIQVNLNLPQQAIAEQKPEDIKKPRFRFVKKVIKKALKIVIRFVVEPILILLVASAIVLFLLHSALPEYYNVIIDKLINMPITKQFMDTGLFKLIVAIFDVIKNMFVGK